MSTRTEREELSKRLKVCYTDREHAHNVLWGLSRQFDELYKLSKICYYAGLQPDLDKPTVEAMYKDVCDEVARDRQLSDEIKEIELKLMHQ